MQHAPPLPVQRAVAAIRAAEACSDSVVASTELNVFQTESLSKTDIKRSRLSPDGVMQMWVEERSGAVCPALAHPREDAPPSAAQVHAAGALARARLHGVDV